MQRAIPAVVMRGGTSKGLYFHKGDLPADTAERDRILLSAMGSPDARQIDGMGGAHPLTSKIAVISKSQDDETDIDYLFLQVQVDKALVSDGQNCGNILAGVGPFAIEQGMVRATGDETTVRIRMVNSGGIAIARVHTPGGQVSYEGTASIDGVPGTSAPVMLDFADVAGSMCGSLLPTGRVADEIDGITVTCIDNGMPVVLLPASDFGKTGCESAAELEADDSFKEQVEAIRLKAGPLMNLGDVTDKTIPKMSMVAPAQYGGAITTRTFFLGRIHQSIGVLAAVSVGTACRIPGTVAAGFYQPKEADNLMHIEHPSGQLTVDIDVDTSTSPISVKRSALLRTTRKLMQGEVFVTSIQEAVT